MRTFRLLVWLTQLGISVAAPLLLCILGSLWLQRRFDLGGWIVFLGIVLGVGSAFSGLWNSLKVMQREAEAEEKDPPVSFNDHQ